MTRVGLPRISAAGGLVVRGDSSTGLEVAVVHRPRYDDWSLPKGKSEVGEGARDCARRETHEETGLLCRVLDPVGVNRYPVADGSKQVEYFLMRPYLDTGFQADEEVDALRWLTPEEAATTVSYPFDKELVESIDTARVLSHTTIHLVRHAVAGDRHEWSGDDRLRPLTAKGERQAAGINRQLSGVGVSRILSSPHVRCLQTVEPLSEALGVRVEKADALAEGASPAGMRALLNEVAGTNAVLCSHGDVIPEMLRLLRGDGTRLESPLECKKGSIWAIFGDDGLKSAVYVPPPAD